MKPDTIDQEQDAGLTIETIVLEKKAVDEFYRLFSLQRFSGQRLGQAFHNHFQLDKIGKPSPQLKRLYHMDGAAAKHHIALLFELT